jgi:hypothetical protein
MNGPRQFPVRATMARCWSGLNRNIERETSILRS